MRMRSRFMRRRVVVWSWFLGEDVARRLANEWLHREVLRWRLRTVYIDSSERSHCISIYPSGA